MGHRPILDLRRSNTYLKGLPFRMLRTKDVLSSVLKKEWVTLGDLKDACFHVPIIPEHRRVLRFSFQGRSYQFRVLVLGLSLAPRVVTRCIQAALTPLLSRGVRILPYLND